MNIPYDIIISGVKSPSLSGYIWLVVLAVPILKNDGVRQWKDYPIYYGNRIQMLGTTNQYLLVSSYSYYPLVN